MGDIKRIFYENILREYFMMRTINNRKNKDLTEAEENKNLWQEYTEELYKKGLNDLDNHNNVVIQLEPDILQCEVK